MTNLEKLKTILRDVNVSDSHMSRGVRLTRAGVSKVARELKITHQDVLDLLAELKGSIAESISRYVYEPDYNGNVTLRDTKTGGEEFIRGDEAKNLVKNLKANPAKQDEIIEPFFSAKVLMEDDAVVIVDSRGTYNFPYRGMIATVEYGFDKSKQFVLNVVSLQQDGEARELTDSLKKELEKIAKTWIDKV